MKYDGKTPCDNCPFRKVGGIPLSPNRIEEIAGHSCTARRARRNIRMPQDRVKRKHFRILTLCRGVNLFGETKSTNAGNANYGTDRTLQRGRIDAATRRGLG